jgi:hypothetical protein
MHTKSTRLAVFAVPALLGVLFIAGPSSVVRG